MCQSRSATSRTTASRGARPAVIASGLVLFGSLLFALANALCKAFFQLDGTEGTLMFARGTLAWAFNGAIARWNGESPATVMFLCGISSSTKAVAVLCGAVNYFVLLLLLLTFDYFISFADAFGIFFSFFTVFTIVFARALGKADRVTPAEIGGSLVTLSGVLLISQPSWLISSTAGAHALNATGVTLSMLAGVGCGAYNVLCRYLTLEGLNAATINSAAMLTIGVLAALALALCATLRRSEGERQSSAMRAQTRDC